jgi:PAS domain S-box-containing protein
MFKQELNTYWKTVVDTIQDGIMIVDENGTIVSVNEAFENITGYSKEEVLGKSCGILNCDVCEIAREKNGSHYCLLFKRGNLRMNKCVLMRKDGSYVHVLKNASILKDADGQVMGAVETMMDISELIEKDTQIEAYRRELRAENGFHGILGASVPMQQVFDVITNAAQSDAPVIIYGESGTGKELVAKAIHELGTRKRKPFVKVNCAALNESLLESELFGHVKGAFTGAHRDRKGRFEAAQGGDIFLDEIGDLPLSTQVKLLRVLEDKIIERVGDNRSIRIDVRIISATNKDLNHLIRQGFFREDLFYRINVIPISVPPLRDRIGDIPLLAESFFRRVQLKSGKKIRGISKEALKILMEYLWPGNVRELKSAFEYAFVSCRDAMIQPDHFPPSIFKASIPAQNASRDFGNLEEMRRRELIEALRKSKGNQSEAARILGVSRVTVWKRMKQFGINNKPKYDL